MKGLWFLVSAVIPVSLLFSVPASSQTLVDALSKAYAGNPALLSARARVRVTDEEVADAASGWRPTVTLDYDIGKSFVDAGGSGGTQNRNPRTASLSIDQNLYLGGQTVAESRQARENIYADRARLISTEQDVLLSVGTSFMNVVRDQAVLDLNRNNERVLGRQLEATRDRFEVGEVTRTDVAQAESRLARAATDRIQAEGNLVKSRASYRAVVGDLPGLLKPAAPLGGLPSSEEEAIAVARDNNPDVIAARHSERAADAAVALANGALLPTLDLAGAMSRRDQASSKTSRTNSASITLELSVPLYQAGAVSSRIRARKQRLGQRRGELNQEMRTAVENATDSWESLLTARAQIRSFRAEVNAAEIALEGVRQEAQVGSRTVLDTLDAEQELLNARVSLVRAQRDEVVASFEVRQASGSLTARGLGLPVQFYQVEKNYQNVRGKWFGTGIGAR
jgi:TolC family type I secretion outer membrane protein